MTQKLNPHCIQLDEVVDPETYVDLILEGHLPPQEVQESEATGPSSE